MNFNKKDAVADAVDSILHQEGLKGGQQKLDKNKNKKLDAEDFKILRGEKKVSEEIDVNDASEEDLAGQKKIKRKDDVGPSGNFKSSKVRFHAGPKNESMEQPLEKVLADTTPHSGIIQTVMATDNLDDGNKSTENKTKLRMKESTTLRGFKQRYEENSIFEQMVQEVLAKDASAGQWIHDFVHSDNPKFAGKSKAERKKQALAAYYAKQRNEETEQVEEGLGEKLKTGAKKFLAKVGGGSDEDQRKRLQKNMGIPQTGKPGMAKQNEEAEQVEEGWDDMVKAAKDSVKSGPKPSGGAGMKQGSRYGGGKQKDKPEQEEGKKEVKESKRPEDDSVPFAPPYNTTSQPAETKDKSGAVHTPMSRAKHLARLAMGRVKKDLGKKA